MAVTQASPHTATKRLTLKNYLGYAAGDAGNNLAFSMASMFLLLYYTDVVGIPAAAAGTIFLVVRIYDAFVDVLIGRLVDRTHTRWGKFRPWILFGSLPLLLASVWAFTLPASDTVGMKLFWGYVSYAVLSTLYSAVNIPYGSLAATMTQVPTERAKLATFRSLGAAATGLMLALVVAPQVQRWSAANLFAGKSAELGSGATQAQLDAAQAAASAEASTGLQSSLTTLTLIFVVVGFLLYFFTFLTAKEQVVRPAEDSVKFGAALKIVVKNKPLMFLCASALAMITSVLALNTLGIYYARDVLGNAGLYPVLSLLMTGAIFVVAPFVSKIVIRFGKKGGYLIGGAVFIVGALLLFVAPASTPAVALVAYFLLGVGQGLFNTLMWAMEADTVEYGEWKSGSRTEGTTYAVFSFVRKLGQAFGGFAAAGIIGLTGYVGAAAVQSPEAIQGIRIAAGLVPAALALLAVLIMARYPLTDSRFKEITTETEARKAAALADSAN
ncbi:glycoside-pentoside-hexuronide (GPH):cation symporter [Georgenia sp. SYP-B2076]|uniref:glycoside-pentoside-hexuronide (GPH):cation symporter n=1 Tax=Georgenia sp. SYP-B2076 TaxID=2495881 RepID=UPI000F8D1BC2|nr:glycoside-pentoside-hexuronide (GPH):cation symporter [Georgenia sp. SYP-B2076]